MRERGADIWVAFITVLIEVAPTASDCDEVGRPRFVLRCYTSACWSLGSRNRSVKCLWNKRRRWKLARVQGWTLRRGRCSSGKSVTFGACVECQLPPRKPAPHSRCLPLFAPLDVTNLLKPLIHVPPPQLFLIPAQIINPWSHRG